MIARAARSLPPGMPSPPSYQKVNPADQPILFLTLSSATMPLSQVDQYAEIGAGAAAVDGQRRRAGQRLRRAEVRRPDRRRSDAARLAADRHRPGRAGDRRRERQPADRHAVRPAAQLRRPDQRPADGRRRAIGRSPVAYRNGSPVRLSEVANVYDGVENPRNASWFNGTPTIYLAIARQPGTNTVAGRRRDQGAAAASCRRSCRRRSSSASAATARSRSASRSTTSSSRCS